MIIQDINHIEVTQEEVVGATGRPPVVSNGFFTFNGFSTEIKNNINLGGASSATAGAVADASSNFSLLNYAKADSGARTVDGRASAFSTSAAATQYYH